MISIFNEEKYALEILHNGFISHKKGLELFILAKYYRFKLNKNKTECKELLTEFCKRQIDDYDNSELYTKVNSTIRQAYKKETRLLEIDNISFMQSELQYINSLNISSVGKQVLFCLWCCNKLNIKAGQSDKWVNITYTELKKFCNLSNGNMFKIMNELYNNDLIFISDRCALCLNFLETYATYYREIFEVSKESFDADFLKRYCIYDFKTCGLWWQKYNGNKNVIMCAECGVLTMRNSNRQKYCKKCARERELDGKSVYNQAYYQQHKNAL
jgi:hypothetical protein